MNKELLHKIIKAWTLFGFNYDSSFVEKAFAGEGECMVEHLKGKFKEAYSIAGMHGSFFYFWCQLSTHLQKTLEEWVMDNFKG